MPPTPPIEYVRVRAGDSEFSLVKSAYEADPDPYTLLDKPATHCDDTPLPAKHHESLSKKKTGRQAVPTPEED